MPVAYSTDLRTRVIDAWTAKEGTQAQLAERFKVSESFVKRVLRRYRSSGQKEAKPRGATLAPTIDGELLKLVQGWVERKPDIHLDELCKQLEAHQGIKVSQPTMCRALQRLKLPRKKNTVRK
ncbi:transposase [Phormidium sp. CLA17]|uniref:helix-turn-helix domain-containing protein n=1 Tax=Leptolyngbya sp. Cla-17 TaxID=2803751 RepID=UPI0014918C81|nr:IS630 transposase-related protein [Leptolyngbya sp. Cla-17]MBM0744495.1 transposase [Leptolyngbya sp. Cla-17]